MKVSINWLRKFVDVSDDNLHRIYGALLLNNLYILDPDLSTFLIPKNSIDDTNVIAYSKRYDLINWVSNN